MFKIQTNLKLDFIDKENKRLIIFFPKIICKKNISNMTFSLIIKFKNTYNSEIIQLTQIKKNVFFSESLSYEQKTKFKKKNVCMQIN